MSIYATWLVLDGSDHDVENCAAYVEAIEGVWDFSGKPCTCAAWKRQPIVYEGSHILPSDGDRRGGGIEVGGIPDHITREGRDDAPEGSLKDWLRIGIWADASTEQYKGKPYVAAGDATVVLPRSLVEELRDTLTAWLDRSGEDAR